MQLNISSKSIKHVIEISKTLDGWHISNLKNSGDCDPEGYPYLYQTFMQNGINYRATLGTCLEAIWHTSESHEEESGWIQEQLNQLSNLINEVNTSA